MISTRRIIFLRLTHPLYLLVLLFIQKIILEKLILTITLVIFGTLYSILQSCSLLLLLWFLYTSTRYCFTSNRSFTKASKFNLLRITLSSLRLPVDQQANISQTQNNLRDAFFITSEQNKYIVPPVFILYILFFRFTFLNISLKYQNVMHVRY